jgi:hypothetical protein
VIPNTIEKTLFLFDVFLLNKVSNILQATGCFSGGTSRFSVGDAHSHWKL